jgi:hypothetical protein
MTKEQIRQLYIRVCRDSGFRMDMFRAAAFAGAVGGFHAMDVWLAMPSLQVMEQIADGTHPAVKVDDKPGSGA